MKIRKDKTMKRTIFMTVLLTILLCACGDKAEQGASKKEVPREDIERSLNEKDIEEDLEEQDEEEKKEPIVLENKTEDDAEQEVKKPIVQKEDNQNSSSQSPKGERPIAPTQTTQDTEKDTIKEEPKKRVDSYSEEVCGPESPFKYGVTQYEWTCNYVALYNDGSKEILAINTETRYNIKKYKATDDELRPEAEEKALANMAYYEEVLRLVNEIRAEVGVGPLTLDLTMCNAATMRAIEMNYSGKFSHTRPNSYSCFSALEYFGIDEWVCGENIAAGQSSPEAVVSSWKNSQGHYENMIRPEYTKMGVGFSNVQLGDYRTYWCQLFTE